MSGVEFAPEARAAIDKLAIGQSFANDAQRVQWMVDSLHRRMSYAEERRLFHALGVTKAVPSPEEIIAAAEGQKRSLEAANTQRRALESQSGDEVRTLREEIAARDRAARLDNARQRVAEEDAAEASYREREIAASLGVSVGELI